METESLRPLIITRDADLLDLLGRLCAAAGVSPEIATGVMPLRQLWSQAAGVLVGDDCADEVAIEGLPRRAGVVLVGRPPESTLLWRAGVAVRADHVAVLPDAERWLVQWLADTLDSASARAPVVAVIGGHGGAGASTLAACLGLTAAQQADSAILIDADSLSGGIDVLVGCEARAGLRWPDLATVEGRVTSPALRAALPMVQGLSVLSTTRSAEEPIDAGAVRTVVAAAQRGYDHVVVDLPRSTARLLSEIAPALDVLIVVATPDFRSVAATGQVTRLATACLDDVRLVVRPTGRQPLATDEVAAALDVRLLGTVPTRPGWHRSVSDGLGPVIGRRDRRRLSAMLGALGTRTLRAAR